jgi:hypothetical protein
MPARSLRGDEKLSRDVAVPPRPRNQAQHLGLPRSVSSADQPAGGREHARDRVSVEGRLRITRVGSLRLAVSKSGTAARG